MDNRFNSHSTMAYWFSYFFYNRRIYSYSFGSCHHCSFNKSNQREKDTLGAEKPYREDIKDGTENVWNDLKESVAKAIEHFK